MDDHGIGVYWKFLHELDWVVGLVVSFSNLGRNKKLWEEKRTRYSLVKCNLSIAFRSFSLRIESSAEKLGLTLKQEGLGFSDSSLWTSIG